VLGPVLSAGNVPYCVSVTDDADSAEPSLLVGARAVLCSSEAARAELCQRFGLKAKRVHCEASACHGASDAPPRDGMLLAWTAAYDACRARAKSKTAWLRRDQLQRLHALYRGSAPLTRPPPRPHSAAAPAPPVEGWVQRIGRRAPDVLRSAWKRLPYPAKQARKPR
jgi:hypothetical protein